MLSKIARPSSTAWTMRGEVVVGQDHVGGLAGDVGAGLAHRDADVGGLERRRVVDAVAGHRDDLAPSTAASGRCASCARARRARTRPRRSSAVLERRRRPSSSRSAPVIDARVGARDDADLARDGLGGQAVVAGDHDDADAGGVALGDGAGDLGARRVLHGLEAEQGQARLHRRHVLRRPRRARRAARRRR